MEIEKNNNKELVPLEHYLKEYAQVDPAEVCSRTGVTFSEEKQAFTLRFLNRDYEIAWPEFAVRCLDEQDLYSPLLDTNQAKIMAIRFLTENSMIASTGKFLTYREVPWGELYYRQFNGRCMKRMEFSYGTSSEKLALFGKNMEKLGARKIDGADAAYEYEIFPGYKVRFLIWEGDEEFPPSSQILFSDNFAAAFHAEDLVVVCEIMISALKRV